MTIEKEKPLNTVIGSDRWLLKILVMRFFILLVWLYGKLFLRIKNVLFNKEDKKAKFDNILVIRLDVLGDIILTTGFLRELRRNNPTSEISIVVRNQFVELISSCPFIDHVIGIERPLPRRFPLQELTMAMKFCRENIPREKFDLVIHPRWEVDDFFASFFIYFTRCSYRLGFSESSAYWGWERQNGLDIFLTQAIHDPTCHHEAERGARLIEHLGGVVEEKTVELWSSPEIRQKIKGILKHNTKCLINIAIAPGSRKSHHRWPADRFAEVARLLCLKLNCRIFVVGGPDAHEYAEEIKNSNEEKIFNVTGQTSILESAELIKNCDFLISNDSGPVHIGSAVKTPVVCISTNAKNCSGYAQGSPERFGPWMIDSFVLQPEFAVSPCQNQCRADIPHCILSISVEDVVAASESLLVSQQKLE